MGSLTSRGCSVACPALIPHSSQLTTHAKRRERISPAALERKQRRKIGGPEGGSALRIGRTLNPFSAPLFFLLTLLLHVPRQDFE